MNDRRAQKGFTLIEVVLALALGGLIAVSLVTTFEVSRRAWHKNNQRSELIQHMRVAMWRMTTELRYAESLLQADLSPDAHLEFTTTTLIDDDPLTTETVHYYRMTGEGVIRRQVPPSAMEILAGTFDGKTTISSFLITPMKIDAGGNLVAMTCPPENLSDAVAVKLQITMTDEDNDSMTVSSMAKMRNKQ